MPPVLSSHRAGRREVGRTRRPPRNKGRPASIEAPRVRELKAQGMRPVDIAKVLKIGRASVYRLLAQAS